MDNNLDRNYLSLLNVENYKILANSNIAFKPLTILIGGNGTGKTTILKCINSFISGSLEDKYEYLVSFGNTDKDIKIDMSFSNYLKFIELDFFDSKINNKFTIYLEKPEFFFYFNNKQNFFLGLKSDISNSIIKPFNKINGLSNKINLNIDSKNDILKIYNNGFDKFKNNLSFFDQFTLLLTKFFNSFYENLEINVRLTGSSISHLSYNFTFNYEILSPKFNNIKFNLKFKDIFPNVILLESERSINLRDPKITETNPDKPYLRKDSQGIISYFHFLRGKDSEDKLDKINKWMNIFGINNLISIPAEDLRTKLQFKSENPDFYIDVKDAGSGIGQLLYLIVECVQAEIGSILLIDEPGVHLHAQYQALVMDLLIETVNRGIQVIVATHSEYFILRLQRRIAEKKISSSNVVILETKISDKKGTIIEEFYFDQFGNYENTKTPEVIKFAQNEFQNWAKAIKRDDL